MGWRFELKHANIVAYITVPTRREPPRITSWQLQEFLGSVKGEYREHPPLISNDSAWVDQVTHVAADAMEFLQRQRGDDQSLLPAELTTEILYGLRHLLGHFELFGLPVGTREDSERLNAFAEHAAFSSEEHALFLIPDYPSPDETLEIFDPSPIVRQIAVSTAEWPGLLFWLRDGSSAFAPLGDAYGLYQNILDGFRHGAERVRRIINDYNSERREAGRKRLLHLSDLHFGTTTALQNQAYLSSHLKGKIETVDRIVITGDLFDNPRKRDALAFRNFRADLTAMTGREPIVIPGNHDQKIKGNSFLWFGRRNRELAELEWSNLIVDEKLESVFFCFDSSKDADFARGKITRDQMMEIATLFEAKAAGQPSVRSYLKVALVHHHPYSFDAETETRVQRNLARFGINDEDFLRMENAEDFLSWCVGREIPLILHGHKHVQRHVTKNIEWPHGKEVVWRDVTAVGCGTSLGIENLPLTYNILEWSPKSRKWTASFYADPGLGTGFEEQYIALHSA